MMLQLMKVGMLVVMCVALAGGTSAAAASLAELMARAERGDVQAQYALGMAYSKGEGVRQDYRKAVVLFSKAADKGHADARYELARHIFSGLGTEEDKVKAKLLFLSAADDGSADAQYHVGTMFARGRSGLKKNYYKAAQWYDKAAAQGHAEAKAQLEKLCAARPPACRDLE